MKTTEQKPEADLQYWGRVVIKSWYNANTISGSCLAAVPDTDETRTCLDIHASGLVFHLRI
jgi:hypothetical protein